jgi:predicted AlkP superfamily phosphohydrolase/phosphomutase
MIGAGARVLMIGLDAAEPELIERWTGDGTLPHLARLRARGSYRRLASSAAWLSGSPWPTFYSGTSPAEHGVYHNLQWRPDRRMFARPGPDWLPLRPFWRALGPMGRRSLVIDVPRTYPPTPFDGVEISGWATHDHRDPSASHPPEALAAIRAAFGSSLVAEEAFGLQTAEALRALHTELFHAVRCVAAGTLDLMRSERWDLCLVIFAATHRGGHRLWNASGMSGRRGPEDDARAFDALRDLYRACDAAVGQLVDAAKEDARVLVFSLHGMGPNTGRHNLLPALLEAVLTSSPPLALTARSGLQRLRQLVPMETRRNLTRRLPQNWQDRLIAFWRSPAGGTARHPVFALPSDQQGYLRVNLQGRERAGTVANGGDLDRLLARVEEGLISFRDADSGAPLIAEIARVADLFPSGDRRDLLPDLIVRWSDSPCACHRAVVSDRHGSIAWPTPGRNPDGRAGNHRGAGFLIASGGSLPAIAEQSAADIRDLAPTACALLGVPPPWPMQGRPIAGLAHQPATT